MPVDEIEVARPYAEAAFDYANAANKTKEWEEMLTTLADLMQSSIILEMLADPRVTNEQARRALADLVKKIAAENDSLGEAFLNFTTQLLNNDRLGASSAILQKYIELKNASEKILEVEIKTAFDLSKHKISEIAEKLKVKYQVNEVNVTVTTDESLVAGMMIIANNQVIDASVKAELNQLQIALNKS